MWEGNTENEFWNHDLVLRQFGATVIEGVVLEEQISKVDSLSRNVCMDDF